MAMFSAMTCEKRARCLFCTHVKLLALIDVEKEAMGPRLVQLVEPPVGGIEKVTQGELPSASAAAHSLCRCAQIVPVGSSCHVRRNGSTSSRSGSSPGRI